MPDPIDPIEADRRYRAARAAQHLAPALTLLGQKLDAVQDTTQTDHPAPVAQAALTLVAYAAALAHNATGQPTPTKYRQILDLPPAKPAQPQAQATDTNPRRPQAGHTAADGRGTGKA